jgi:hypothetical protein
MKSISADFRKDTFLKSDNGSGNDLHHFHRRYCNINESGCRKAFNRVGNTIK